MRPLPHLATLALGIAPVIAPALAAAETNDEITMGSSIRALRSDSANAVTSDSLGGGHLGYARELPIDLVPGLHLWATAGLGWGNATGMLFGTMTTEIDTVALTAGGRAVYTLHPNLAVSGRLELGSARTELTLDDTLSDAAWAGVASSAVAVDLALLARPQIAIGLRFELGYVTATAPALAPRGPREEDTIVLPEMPSSFGSLDLGGRYVSFSLLTRF